MAMMLHTILQCTSLAVAISIPFVGTFIKRELIDEQETQFFSSTCFEPLQNKRKRWKPHPKMRSVWCILFVLMGTASWLVMRQGGLLRQKVPLALYATLLVVDQLSWPPIFTGGYSFRFAVLDLLVLLLTSMLTIAKFYEASPTAGILLLPYLGWTCFATTLINCSFLTSNPQVVAKAQRIAAVKHSDATSEQMSAATAVSQPPSAKTSPTTKELLEAERSRSSGRTLLTVDPPKEVQVDQFPSPFSTSSDSAKSPLQQARDLLAKTVAVENASPDMLRSSMLRVNSLLARVSTSIANQSQALPELPRLTSFSNFLSRVSLSLHRGGSDASVEHYKWPCSDSIPESFFSCPGVAGYKVRGQNYLKDKKKVTPDTCQGQLLSVNLVSLKEPTFHIARFLPSIRDSKAPFVFVWQVMVPGKTHISLTVAWALDHDPEAAMKSAASMIPEDAEVSFHGDPVADPEAPEGNPSGQATPIAPSPMKRGKADELVVEASSKSTSAVEARRRQKDFAGHRRTHSTVDLAPPEVESGSGSSASLQDLTVPPASSVPVVEGASPFDVAMVRFLDATGSEADIIARRHSMFKIIPRIEKGGWVVKQAVGQNTPVLLGKKLTTKYFRGPKYIEVDVDVGSSRSAASVVGLVQGALKSLVIDIAILLEGHTVEELPESLLGTIRLEHLDLSKAATLDTSTGTITRKE